MSFPHPGLDWRRDGADWPLRAHSRFVETADLRWHVQVLGRGPAALLLHGVGGASHSWRDVAPLLAARMTVVIPDLPGHGFSAQGRHAARTLPGMAAALRALCAALDVTPRVLAGHSAGAAAAARMALDAPGSARAVVAFNGAFMPFKWPEAVTLPSMARLMAVNPFSAPAMAVLARSGVGARVMTAMMARRDPEALRLYTRLFGAPGHVAAALNMMAAWDLGGLAQEIAGMATPITVVVGDADRVVAPREGRDLARATPSARLEVWPGLGHLAHEEAPERAAATILQAAGPETAGPETAGPQPARTERA